MSLWLFVGFGGLVWLPLAAATPARRVFVPYGIGWLGYCVYRMPHTVTVDDATIVFDLAFRRRFVVRKDAVTRMWLRGAAIVIEWRDGARYRRAYLMPPMTNRAEVMGALAGGPWGKRRRS